MNAKGFVPTQHLMDGGYISAEWLALHHDSETQIIGPARRPSTASQQLATTNPRSLHTR